MAEIIENFVSKPVIDETGLKEKYDWELSYSFANKSVLLESLGKELGLELIAAKKPVELLIIDKEPINN